MHDFLTFFNQVRYTYRLRLAITYSDICTWEITIGLVGSGENGDDLIICDIQDSDVTLCFAKAHVALKEELTDIFGGY